MTEYGCCECHKVTENANERFIVPFTHMTYCQEHRPDRSIPLSELIIYGNSWSSWKWVRSNLPK